MVSTNYTVKSTGTNAVAGLTNVISVLKEIQMLTEKQVNIRDQFLPVLSGFSGSVSDHFGVNSARHTVVQLRVELRKDIKRVD